MFHIVYKVTNLINEKIYIGVHAVTNLNVDDGYWGSGLGIQRALNKHGLQNFKKEVLAAFTNRDSAYLMETALVDLTFVLREDTYNMRPGGCGGSVGGKSHPWYGRHHSEETKQKQAAALSGKKRSEVTKQKMSAAVIGEKHPFYGEHHSEETKQKMSEAQRDEKHPNYGKKLSQETKRKMTEAQKERWRKRRELSVENYHE